MKICTFEWKNQTIFVDQFSGPGTDGKFGPNLFDGNVLEINFDRSELVTHRSVPRFAIDKASNYPPLDLSIDRGAMYAACEPFIGGQQCPNTFGVCDLSYSLSIFVHTSTKTFTAKSGIIEL